VLCFPKPVAWPPAPHPSFLIFPPLYFPSGLAVHFSHFNMQTNITVHHPSHMNSCTQKHRSSRVTPVLLSFSLRSFIFRFSSFFSTSTLCLLCCFWSGSVWLLYIFGSSELSFTFLLFARSYTSCMLFLLYLIFIKKELSQMVFYSLPLINAPSTTTKTEKNASLSCVMMNYSIRFRVLLIPAPCFLFFFYSHSVLPSSLLLLSPLSFIPPPYYTSLFFLIFWHVLQCIAVIHTMAYTRR